MNKLRYKKVTTQEQIFVSKINMLEKVSHNLGHYLRYHKDASWNIVEARRLVIEEMNNLRNRPKPLDNP